MKHLMVMAAGTGAHIFPGLAIAETMRARGWQVSWLGTQRGMEAEIVPRHGLAFDAIDFSGLRGKGLMHTVTAVFKLAANAAIRPDESVGEGRKAGYERHSSRRCRVFVRAISGRDLDLAWCAIGQTYFTEVVGERSKKCDMRLRGGKAGRKARKAAKRIEAIFVIETVFSRGLLFSASPFH